MGRRIEVEVDGAKADFDLREDLAPQTTAAFWESLPVETTIRHGVSRSASYLDVEHGPIAGIPAEPELGVTSIYKGYIVLGGSEHGIRGVVHLLRRPSIAGRPGGC